MDFLKKVLSRLMQVLRTLTRLNQRLDEIAFNQGLILSKLNENLTTKELRAHEFKVFSQWGEDGIIQHLIKKIPIQNRTFIEFGVEDFSESNCRFLLMKDDWRGFVIDGSASNIQRLRQSYYFWKHDLQAIDTFITRENINDLLAKSGFDEDLGILSVDIDGNDYFVLEAIESFKPRILICEYNAVFGATRKISVPYQPDFYRTAAHSSNLYFGASLAAITDLASRKGYSLIGTNSAGCNAFFVRNDLLTESLPPMTAEEAYTPSSFRESRNSEGTLTYLTGDERLASIQGMPVLNVETNTIEAL